MLKASFTKNKKAKITGSKQNQKIATLYQNKLLNNYHVKVKRENVIKIIIATLIW